MIYLLCGFMGSGKSTLLKKFSKNTNTYQCFDLDEEIFKKAGQGFKSLAEFIESKGWDHFRRRESETLEEFLKSSHDTVLALGGGAVSGVNVAKIKGFKEARMVYLNCPFEVCFERIADDKSRPLVKLGKEKLLDLYNERVPLYELAQIHLSSEQLAKIESPEQLLQS
ncbi:MAG: AAA family ATPase [Bacteriovoracaceae bacterium]|nr:AAA family ATPase [Bacteriovoracaceae bacterium]